MNIRIKILISTLAITVIAITVCFSIVETPAMTEINSQIEKDKKYILKDYNGMLAIFESNQNTPTQILDVDINSLPERDIERIKQGIYADSLNEIISLAEDYE